MDYSQYITDNEPEIESYKIDSISHTTAAEEKALWREYVKWRHIKRILKSECVLNDLHKASPIVISQVIEEIGSFHDLVVLLRHHVGLDRVGDRIIEDENNTTLIRIELNRFIQLYRAIDDEKINNGDSKTCCLEDLFGCIFGVTLNNIAFGGGNPNLVNEIAKAANRELSDIKESLFRLAINRALLPKSLIGFLGLKIQLNELPNWIKSLPPDFFSELVSDYYQAFLNNIKGEGEKAFERIIESHLWVVMDIVNKHFNEIPGLSFDDLIQEGNIGLIEAAERFQPTRSARFMQYAHWWIFQKIQRAIADQARTIRTPVHMFESIDRLLRTRLQLSEKYGREPTYTEIAERMGISSDKVEKIVKVAKLPVSIESPIGEEEDMQLSDFIEDQVALPLVDAVSKELLKEQIDEVLSSLTPRERRVLELRFGLEDGKTRTLEEVGELFNVTRERIRQIQEKALRRLRHPSRSRKLKDFLE